jgi:hypothetical protein
MFPGDCRGAEQHGDPSNTLSEMIQHIIALQEMWARCADKPDILRAMNGSLEAFGFSAI